jgi:hypothetical protein
MTGRWLCSCDGVHGGPGSAQGHPHRHPCRHKQLKGIAAVISLTKSGQKRKTQSRECTKLFLQSSELGPPPPHPRIIRLRESLFLYKSFNTLCTERMKRFMFQCYQYTSPRICIEMPANLNFRARRGRKSRQTISDKNNTKTSNLKIKTNKHKLYHMMSLRCHRVNQHQQARHEYPYLKTDFEHFIYLSDCCIFFFAQRCQITDGSFKAFESAAACVLLKLINFSFS